MNIFKGFEEFSMIQWLLKLEVSVCQMFLNMGKYANLLGSNFAMTLNIFTDTLAKNMSELQQPTQATTPFALKIWKEHFCWNNLSYWICTMLVYLPSITSHIGIINIYMGIGRTEVFGMSDDEEASKRCWATLSDFVTALLSTESMQCSTYSGDVVNMPQRPC